MSKNKNRTRRIYGIILISFVIIWVGCVSLQMLSNRHNAWIASEMILQQLEDVIEENKESYQTLLETLKEEYTLRAETVARLSRRRGPSSGEGGLFGGQSDRADRRCSAGAVLPEQYGCDAHGGERSAAHDAP